MPGERTEQATQHRREKAQKEGDVLHSRELSAAAGTLAGVLVLGALGTQLKTQNDALSSVNLDDEASSMTTLERSYQAASQVFTMLNTIMGAALNLGDQTTVS